MTVSTLHETTHKIGRNFVPIQANGIYDFSKQGGAVGDINLPLFIPARCVVTNVLIVKKTAFTSGGSATVALKAVSTGDILAATAYDNAAFTAACSNAKQNGISNMIVNDSDSQVQVIMTVAAAALTAGKYEIILSCRPLSNVNA